MRSGADRSAIAFGEHLLAVLGEGVFTSTYKYAVVLGLLDLCLEHAGRTGSPPESVTTRQLAEKVIALYWPHARLFDGRRVLRQNSGGQAEILSSIEKFLAAHADGSTPTLHRASRDWAADYEKLVRRVEWVLVEMPLPKLQRIGREVVPFLYQIRWSDDVRRRDLSDPGFDNLIRFVPGAGDHLVRLAGLIRPLVQREWASLVARLNPDLVPDAELDRFLFDAERAALDPVREELANLQNGDCFYCETPLDAVSHVDHFIPWSRHPDNGLDNLVVAHARCNGKKRDRLAAHSHVDHWREWTRSRSNELSRISKARGWPRDERKTLSVARAIYLRLPAGTRLWLRGNDLEPLDPERMRSLLVDPASAPEA
jgi:hypothetical protein